MISNITTQDYKRSVNSYYIANSNFNLELANYKHNELAY